VKTHADKQPVNQVDFIQFRDGTGRDFSDPTRPGNLSVRPASDRPVDRQNLQYLNMLLRCQTGKTTVPSTNCIILINVYDNVFILPHFNEIKNCKLYVTKKIQY